MSRNLTEPESFSFLSWKTKVLFLKKYFLSPTAKLDPKDGVSRLNFPEGFAPASSAIEVMQWP